jgi:peptidoglycan/xylan/chitin deacetylase (PgdA/CDA1 family)
MLMPLAQQAVAAVRRSRNRLLNLVDTPGVVLVYHRVTSLSSDPQLLAISPENFRAHMKHLKSNFPIVRFEDDWSNVKEPSIAVTFDDGYADNVIEALPILEEIGVPATFFISTGNLDTMHEYWWDELERIIMGERDLPERFTLISTDFRQDWPTASPASRETFYQQLLPLMMQLDPARREEWLIQLRQWAQVGEKGREAYRAMTSDELRYLAGSEWVTIGAHTVTHTPLSILTIEKQREEILSSKHQLETLIGKEIKTFSYPFGRKKDYDRTSIHLCREAGFIKAASNFPGQVHRWTDQYQLPRHLVRNWDIDTFTHRVKDFWVQ